ncbi:MAG TPA: TonB-dependent receptor [Pyrinomonadaceae bacterium]|nr:TonB-dependent receptor [Pyrinomonadaceae bacterium]
MKRHSLLGSGSALILGALLVLFVCSISGISQQGTATLRGIVNDPQGNVVAGATVTLTNLGTNVSRTTTSSDTGAYSFDFIQVGDYRLEVEAKGFKKAVVPDIHALVAKATSMDVELELGDVSESVTVTGGGGEALINRDDATLGNNFVNKQIAQLPLEARNVVSLLTLQPGVTRDGYVSGARSDQSNVTLDGVDINEAQTNQIGAASGTASSDSTESDTVTASGSTNSPDASTVIRLNAEAIEEFRVTTSNPNASQGRSSGGQIALVTKTGTNDFHGALFEAHRNTIFTANDFFNNRNGRYEATDANVILGINNVGDERNPRPKLIRNTFGGAIGGRLIKDRLFFFYSFEGRRDAAEQSVVRVVPLASMGQGLLRYVNPSGGVTTLSAAEVNTIFSTNGATVGTNPLAIAALAAAAAKYPANDFTQGDSTVSTRLNTAGFRFNAPTPVKLNSHSARFDMNLTDRQSLFVRANVIYDLIGLPAQFPDTPAPQIWSHPVGLAVGHTWTLTNNLVNNFRFGYTREAFTQAGDSAANAITFRFVFSPLLFNRTVSRKTPVTNFTDDISLVRGSHSLQFGANVRLIKNNRVSFGNAYDSAVTNPSFYSGGAGTVLSDFVNDFSPIADGFESAVQNAVTALIGRYSQYTARFTFNHEGMSEALGTPTDRTFATQEYDAYGQDVWKVTPNLTITYGLRYSLSRPVYETNGFEVKPNIPLTDYFNRRLASAAQGIPFFDPITVDLSGPANNRSPLYRWDKNNFQPRIAVAYSPGFKTGLLAKLFGANHESVFRGGFGITNDYYGNQLAVNFDLNNQLGFSSQTTISANTYNISTRPAPLFTGFGQDVRTLPGIGPPGTLTFPQQKPANDSRRIESTLDEALVAPTNYSWNATFERQLPKGLVLQASYIGRLGRHLLAQRDIMALNNLVDPQSRMDWYTAAGMLELLRAQGTPISSVQQIPYFANLFPADLAAQVNANYFGETVLDESLNQTQAVYQIALEVFGNDWTDTQDALDTGINAHNFFNPQYGALAAFSSIGNSFYNAGTISLRERLGEKLTLDFNYTLSHSRDDASGLQTSGLPLATFGNGFILNPIRQRDWYADSDFDVRHIVNVNAIWQLPIGRGQWLLGNTNKVVNGILGGWQLAGIYRWNSGLPAPNFFDDARWATNWNVQSSVVRAVPLQACPDRGGADAPKLFGCDPTRAYQSFRNALPGESGDRNVFRLPGYVTLDLGLSKSFNLPWGENQKFQIRWETFNVTNTQHFGKMDISRTGTGVTLDPGTATPPSNWSNFVGIQGTPRVMQFGFRYSF